MSKMPPKRSGRARKPNAPIHGSDEVPGDARVGYGRPPQHTQYRKGQSGNPKGRPRGSFNVQTIREAIATHWFEQLITVNVNGRARQITRFDALMTKLTELGLKGDRKAIKDCLDFAVRMAGSEVQERAPEESAAEDAAILHQHLPGAQGGGPLDGGNEGQEGGDV